MDKKRQEDSRDDQSLIDRGAIPLKGWHKGVIGYHIFYLCFVLFFLDNWIDDPSPHFAYLQGAISFIGLIVLVISAYRTRMTQVRLEEKRGQNNDMKKIRRLFFWLYLLFAVLTCQYGYTLYRAIGRLMV